MATSDLGAPSRRRVLAALAAGAFLLLMPAAARATATARAESLVAAVAGELLGLVNSGRSEAQLYRDFERVLAQAADMPAVAASVLGQPWRGASAAQRQSFVGAFQTYLSRRYGRQFREYRNARIAIERVRDGGNSGVLVETTVLRPGQESLTVEWQVSERSGAPKVVNLIIEGVSMLANERAEIGALLDAERGSIDGLIGALRARA